MDEAEVVGVTEFMAAHGNAEAQCNLANMCTQGFLVRKDQKRAERLWTMASNQGHATSQINLASLHQKGIGMKKDVKKAVELYELAAAQDAIIAQRELGYIYLDHMQVDRFEESFPPMNPASSGVPRDLSKAFDMFTRASSQGDTSAQYQLAMMHYHADDPVDEYGKPLAYHNPNMSKDVGKALELWELLAEKGHVQSQYIIGIIYLRGDGVKMDFVKARQMLELAVEQGDASAQLNLGDIYYNGQGVMMNRARAASLYELAAAQTDQAGSSRAAQALLGMMYDEGDGVKRDLKKSKQMFALAAAQGCADSRYALTQLGGTVEENGFTVQAEMGHPKRKKSCNQLPIGATVCVFGLVGASEHNGKEGTVAGPLDTAKGRYPIALHSESSQTKRLGLKPDNLLQVLMVRNVSGTAMAVVCSKDESQEKYQVKLCAETCDQPSVLREAPIDLWRFSDTIIPNETLVKLINLSTKEWNGKRGIILGCDLESGRYEVQVGKKRCGKKDTIRVKLNRVVL